MKAAIISDIHGNTPALIATLAAIDNYGPDLIYVLGDVVQGVDERGALLLLLDRANTRFLQGNVDYRFSSCIQGNRN